MSIVMTHNVKPDSEKGLYLLDKMKQYKYNNENKGINVRIDRDELSFRSIGRHIRHSSSCI
jgi:hypothetical protein